MAERRRRCRYWLRHYRGRKFLNKADSIRQQQLAAVGQTQAAGYRIQRIEQLILGGNAGVAEGVEQRTLAGVGIAHQRSHRRGGTAAALQILAAPLPHIVQFGGDFLNAAADDAAVGFQLRFARAARADAPAQPFQMRPLPHQARQQILMLRQLNLHLPLARMGVPPEHIQNQGGAVDDLDL